MRKELAAHVGREGTVLESGGRKWKISKLTRAVTRDFERWAAGQLESPLRAARDEVEQFARRAAQIRVDTTLTEPEREEMLAANLRQQEQITALLTEQTRLPMSVRANALLSTPDGCAHMLWLLLRKYQPDATEDDAFDVLIDVGLGMVQGAIDQAAGQTPEKNSEPPAATS